MSTPAPVLTGRHVWRFVSAPRLRPMRVTVRVRRSGTAPGDVFTAPYSGERMTGRTGVLITDDSGAPVWFRPLPSVRLEDADFRVQRYVDRRRGTAQPVLTWWQGTISTPPAYRDLPPGASRPGGCYYVYDRHYRLLTTVAARHGYAADQHEFLLTRRGTALFLASRPVPMDLRRYGGPRDGAILDTEVQEVDLATGRLVFSWSALAHLDPADSMLPASSAASSGNVWDPFHLNSVDDGPGGRLLVSARNMWAVYDIRRGSGTIRRQLGGRHGDFRLGPGAAFSWQHDARFLPGGRISLFDNGCCDQPSGTPQHESRGLVLALDPRARTATAVRTYYHRPPLHSPTQGNAQVLVNGDVFTGWGHSPYYSEYAAAGNTAGHGARNLRYDAALPGNDITYRAYRFRWTGTPYYPPRAAARTERGRTVVHASWNGSTRTAAWQLLAGPRPDALRVVVRRVRRSGFETAVATTAPGPYYQVRALDSAGRALRSSRVARRP